MAIEENQISAFVLDDKTKSARFIESEISLLKELQSAMEPQPLNFREYVVALTKMAKDSGKQNVSDSLVQENIDLIETIRILKNEKEDLQNLATNLEATAEKLLNDNNSLIDSIHESKTTAKQKELPVNSIVLHLSPKEKYILDNMLKQYKLEPKEILINRMFMPYLKAGCAIDFTVPFISKENLNKINNFFEIEENRRVQ